MTTDPSQWAFETRQVHAGQVPDPTTGARALPIYQTTSYQFRDTEHAAALFGLSEMGNIYTRLMNPTNDVVEQRIAALEGGVGALLVASGQAAETLAIINIAEAGDHIVAAAPLYGGTFNLIKRTLPRYGIEATFVEDVNDVQAWRDAVQPNTKLFFAETISNPRSAVLDVRAVADAAHEAGVPLVVDNTIATPWVLRPIEHGADVVLCGVSRTSKTPTSIYLANRGIRTANVPLVPGIPLPHQLETLKKPLVVSLHATPERLIQVRQNRLLTMGDRDNDTYIDKQSVADEVAFARRLSAKFNWALLDVTRRSIEETAAAVMKLYNDRQRARPSE